MSEATYLAIRGVLFKWYGLGQDRTNLQALLEITELVDKELERAKAPEDAE